MSGSSAALLVGLQMLFVGDSITAGGAADPGLGFVERVATSAPGWDVVNAGCAGATSRDWVLPQDPDLPEHCAFTGAFEELAAPHAGADVVHILLGTNDSTGFFEEGVPVSPGEYAQNIGLLAARFGGDVLVSIPVPFPDATSGSQVLLDAYAVEIVALAAAPGAPFRLGADFSGLDRARLDGVHPDNDGHAWMAGQLLPLLVPEPASGSLLGLGLVVAGAARGRRIGRG